MMMEAWDPSSSGSPVSSFPILARGRTSSAPSSPAQPPNPLARFTLGHASGTYDKDSNTGGSNFATMRFEPESKVSTFAPLIPDEEDIGREIGARADLLRLIAQRAARRQQRTQQGPRPHAEDQGGL